MPSTPAARPDGLDPIAALYIEETARTLAQRHADDATMRLQAQSVVIHQLADRLSKLEAKLDDMANHQAQNVPTSRERALSRREALLKTRTS